MYSLASKASRDLDAILDYSITNFGADVMIKYYKSLEKCFETFDENPGMGTEVEHIRSDYLCFEHRSHLILYKNNENTLIIRILHKSMDAIRLFSIAY